MSDIYRVKMLEVLSIETMEVKYIHLSMYLFTLA